MNFDELWNYVLEYNDKMIAIRRDMGEHPELSYKEFRTAKIVADTPVHLKSKLKRM